MADKLKVFLCHATENKPIVNGLYDDLVSAGYDPWLDTDDILPGMAPDMVIQNALHECDIVIICLSSISVAKEGYVQKEIKWAQGIQDEKPEGTIFVIPLRLDDCKVPFGLKDIQWGDYTAPDGFEKLVRSLNRRAEQLGKQPGDAKKKRPLIPDDSLPLVGDLPIGSYLPFPPNPLFEGRVNDLKKLAESLLSDSSKGIVVNQTAITGMGGLGKTQLAVEFAYRYGRYYRGVHWLNLADPSLLDSEIARSGIEMSLANWPDDQPSQVALTLNTWKSDSPRLLILDNFEDVGEVNNVLTRLRHSGLRLLITSRRRDWPPTAGLNSLVLELFAPEESLAFLKNSLKERKDKVEDLQTLAERLGNLPLALELASRYLKGHARLRIMDYLEQTKQSFDHPSMRDWRKDLPAPTQHDLDLQRTFALSWEEIKDEAVQKLFLTTGYLAPNSAVPLEIFEKALEITSEACDEALDTLYGLGLLRKSEDDQPTIHPLLAEYARGLAKEKDEIIKNLADVLATLAYEANGTGLPFRFVPIRPHMPVTASYAEEASLQDAGAMWNEYGYHLKAIANYDSARTIYERALKIFEKQLGAEHPNVAVLVNNLGGVMMESGDLESARTMFEHALKIDEAYFDPDHPNVARDVNNLGMVMKKSGDLEGARTMYERALKIGEATLGENHPTIAIRTNNLGLVLKAQGDLENARIMLERALKIDEASFGTDHPNVAYAVNNLGLLMKTQGDLNGARIMLKRALEIFKKFLPPDHPNITTVQENLDSLGDS